MGVRILLGTPLCARVRKPAKRVGSNPTVWRFDFSREHQLLQRSAAVAQLAEAAGLNPVQCRIVACLRHQLPALPVGEGSEQRRLAQRKSVGPTNRRSRYRNSQRLPNINNPSCSSKAEQPADNRQTADRYRAGGPNKETDMHDPLKRGVLWTPSVQPIGSAVDF
jgi:hypothetical protein